MPEEMVIFTRTFDFLTWLLPATNNFPRAQRNIFTRRLVEESIPFLGFVVFPERRRLKRREDVHYRRRLRGLARAGASGHIELDAVTSSVRGWANHARDGNTIGLRKAVLGTPFAR